MDLRQREIHRALSDVWGRSSSLSKETAKFYFECLLRQGDLSGSGNLLFTYHRKIKSNSGYSDCALEYVFCVARYSQCEGLDQLSNLLINPKAICDSNFNLQHCFAELAHSLSKDEVECLFQAASCESALGITEDQFESLKPTVRAFKLFSLLRKRVPITEVTDLSTSNLYTWVKDTKNAQALKHLDDFIANPNAEISVDTNIAGVVSKPKKTSTGAPSVSLLRQEAMTKESPPPSYDSTIQNPAATHFEEPSLQLEQPISNVPCERPMPLEADISASSIPSQLSSEETDPESELSQQIDHNNEEPEIHAPEQESRPVGHPRAHTIDTADGYPHSEGAARSHRTNSMDDGSDIQRRLREVYSRGHPYANSRYVPQSASTIDPTFSVVQSEFDTTASAKSLEYDEVFRKVEHGKRVIITAPPGHGKSSLPFKVRRDWASHKALQNINYFFHVEMKSVKQKVQVEDVLDMQLPLVQSAVYRAASTFQYQEAKICLFFDGVTESNITHIEHLVNGSRYPHAFVFVTCNENATDLLRERIRPDKVVLLNRFTESQIRNHLDKIGQTHYLEMFPQLADLVRAPLHLGILEYILNHSKGSQLTFWKIMEAFCVHLINHAKNKDSGMTQPNNFGGFNAFTRSEQSFFHSLCDIAFQSMISLEEMHGITKEQVLQCCTTPPMRPDDCFSIFTQSLLIARKPISSDVFLPKEKYSFCHPSITKYLAARHLTKLQQDAQMQAIRENMRVSGFYDVLKHFFGLSASLLEDASKRKHLFAIFDMLTPVNRSETQMLHCHCAFEAQSSSLCKRIIEQKHPGSTVVSINSESLKQKPHEGMVTLTPADSNVLGYVLKTQGQVLDALELYNIGLSAKSLSMLNKHIKEPLDLTTLKVTHSYQNSSLEEVAIVKELACLLAKAPKLTVLWLCGLCVESSDVVSLLFTVVSRMESLAQLYFTKNSLKENHCELFGQKVEQLHNLKELDLSYNRFGNGGLQKMAEGLQECTKLEQLVLRECGLKGEEAASILTKILVRMSGITVLNLQGNQLTGGAAKLREVLMRDQCKIEQLDVSENELTEGDVYIFVRLTRNEALQTLNLQKNKLPEAVIQDLSKEDKVAV